MSEGSETDDGIETDRESGRGNESGETIRTGDLVVGSLLTLGALTWLAAGLGVGEHAVAGVGTTALGTALVAGGFLAHAVDRILAGEPAIAGVVTVFAVGLATSYVGRSGGDRTVWAAGGFLMLLGAAGYAYLQFRPDGS